MTDPTSRRAMCVGHVTLDRYPDGLRIGGSAWYAARCFEALGYDTTLVTAAGADFDARDWPAAFRGLDCRMAIGGETTVFKNVYPASGPRIQTVETIAPAVTPEALKASDRERGLDVLFIAPVIGEVPLDAWRDAVDARIVALGAQGYLKAPGPQVSDKGRRVSTRAWPSKAEDLHGIDLCFLSVEDLGDRDELLPRIVEGCPRVALTRGREGATLIEGRLERHIPPVAATELDPTGAGDTFAAGLLAGLARGLDVEAAGRQGATMAARVVEALAGDRLTSGEAFDDVRCLGSGSVSSGVTRA